MKSTPERRKVSRFTPAGYFFAAVRPDYKRFGKVMNISTDGLLFHCVSGIDDPFLQEGRHVSIDVFSKHGNIFVLGIPCKVVKEERLPKKDGMITSVEMRSCRIEFLALSGDQAARLNYLLAVAAKETLSEAPSAQIRPG